MIDCYNEPNSKWIWTAPLMAVERQSNAEILKLNEERSWMQWRAMIPV
jgi:tRNA uridine 5-carbamoylmethylation protein Kti12